jgi:hypothetical protein
MLDCLMSRFLVKWCLRQEPEDNLCGYYVCGHLMSQSYSLKTSEEILEVLIHKFLTIVLIYTHTLITYSYSFLSFEA